MPTLNANTLKTLPQTLRSLAKSRPALALGVFTLLALAWAGLILPTQSNLNALTQEVEANTTALYDMRSMGGQIKALEASLSEEQRKGSFGSPLQQLERIATEYRLSTRMSRVNPVKLSDSEGRSRNGLDVTFEDVSLYALTPFLHALTYKSLLQVEALEMRTGSADGLLVVKLRLSGDGA